jgi:PKD repeat protein
MTSTNEVKSPSGTFPFTGMDSVSHTYGDDGLYTITLTVEDDDGGITTYSTDINVNNVVPEITLIRTYPDDEGSRVTFEAEATDSGSDDLTYSWEIEYGPKIENTYYNNWLSPDPVYDPEINEIKSPMGNYPFWTSDVVTHIYGDDYEYTIILTVTDDDGGVTTSTTTVTVNNLAPSLIEINIPTAIDEGSSATFEAHAEDMGSDALPFTWDFEYGSSITNVHYNDGVNPDPYPSPWGDDPFDVSDTVQYTYGDDGVYSVSLTVEDDDGGFITYSTDITVRNVDPSIDLVTAPGGDEAEILTYVSTATDRGSDDLTFSWNWGDGTSDIVTIYYNDGSNPDPYPSPWGNYPFSVSDSVSHSYGDNGIFTLTLTVEDDDGGMVSYSTDIAIDNVAPTLDSVTTPGGDEGSVLSYFSSATDPGSDDLTFTWSWGDGTSDTQSIYYNDGMGPDPNPSPWGTFPFSVGDTVQHIYGDNGVFSITLEIEDDDGGIAIYTTDVTIDNVAPTITPFGPFSYDEGSFINLMANANDPGSDDLTFTWEFELGPTITNFHYNDGFGPDPYLSPWGTFPYSVTDPVEHMYGDNGNYMIYLTVEDDDGGVSTYESYVVVDNVSPSIEKVEAYVLVNFTLRIAGEKWHDVEMQILADGSEVTIGEVIRNPGNPDEQTLSLFDVKCDITKNVEIKIIYTPMDDPLNGRINGATSVWVTMDFEDGEDIRLHHTCNVRHPDTWEWTIGVNQYLGYHNITFEAESSDPGSDDLTFCWDWGDGSPIVETLCCNDGINPEPLYEHGINDIRSPWGICPFSANDKKKHSYVTGGNYSVTLTVTDDDGGTAVVVITVILV